MSDTTLPHPSGFHLKAAVGWLELGSPEEARRELEAIDPEHGEHPDVLEVWWPILVEEKDWTAALAAAEKLVARAPEREVGWVQQSFALHELQRTSEAYERLVQVADRFVEAYVIPYNLACYQCRMGNRGAAMKWLKRAVKIADAKTIRAMAQNDPDLAPLRSELARLD
jgi:predicted Zn-dependent protease